MSACLQLQVETAGFRMAVEARRGPSLEQYFELLVGPGDAGSTFASEECRRAAWRSQSEKLTRLVEPGSRPWGWWEYDAPEPALPRESELDYLARCDLLTEAERARLAHVYPAARATRNP